jgi:cell division protein FtsW
LQHRRLALTLLIVPPLALGVLGLVMVATAGGRAGAAGLGAPAHFAARQAIGLGVAAVLAVAVARIGVARALRAAPVVFVIALLATAAVFIPGIGVRAAGASRWLRLGPLSGNPAPFLIGAVGLVLAARSATPGAGRDVRARPLAVTLGLTLLSLLILVAEPDFSAAAVALSVALAALAGGGAPLRRLAPAALLFFIALGLGASRFGYVGGRVHGFLAPERDRRGKGFEVLALARANANATIGGVGLGRGTARRHLSSPASDYVFALVGEELGRRGAVGVLVAWGAIGAGTALAARSARGEQRHRAVAAAAGVALLAPAALHIAVCRGWLPIIGVSMPLVSYDPALTVASGGELGLLAAVVLSRRGTEA